MRGMRAWFAIVTVTALVSVTACGGATPSGGAQSSAAPSLGTELVVEGYGGEYQQIFNKTIKEPFEKQFGIKITYDIAGSGAQAYAKIKAAQGNPGWDVAIVTGQEPVQGAKDGILAEIPESKVPNLKSVYPEVRKVIGNFGGPEEIQYMSLMYNTKHFSKAPESWDALADPANKGHVILFDPANIIGVFNLFIETKMHGGDVKSNLDPGFVELEKIKPLVMATPIASSDATPYLENGTVWLMPYWDGRAAYYKDQGLPYDFTIPKEGSVVLLNALVIPKGAPHLEAAYAFVNYWLSKEVQSAWAKAYTVGPVRGDATLPADFKGRHVTSVDDINKMLIPDFGYIAANRLAWTERWRKIMSK